MSNIIAFLDTLGRESKLRYADKAELAERMIGAGIDARVSEALLANTARSAVETLLGAQPNVCCGIAPAAYEDYPAPAVQGR